MCSNQKQLEQCAIGKPETHFYNPRTEINCPMQSICVAHISSALVCLSCVLSVKDVLLLMWMKNERVKLNDSISQYHIVMLFQLVIFDLKLEK